jgi:hypothetical protein
LKRALFALIVLTLACVLQLPATRHSNGPNPVAVAMAAGVGVMPVVPLPMDSGDGDWDHGPTFPPDPCDGYIDCPVPIPRPSPPPGPGCDIAPQLCQQ